MTEAKEQRGVEILCIGTELLLGNILNDNARWLAEELAALGQPHYRQTVVGDNSSSLASCVREAASRCSVLLTTGGLGSTSNNLTIKTLAAAFDAPLEERLELWDEPEAKVPASGNSDPSQGLQTYLPQGAQALPNPLGTAMGMIWTPKPGFTILSFPGIPSEMREMWRRVAVPWLRQYSNYNSGVLINRLLHFSDVGEPALVECVADLLGSKNPTLSPYTSLGSTKLRLTVQASDVAQAANMLDSLEREILLRTGRYCYGREGDSLASVVLDLLQRHNHTLAVAESCTGGGLAAALAAIPKCSNVFLGGVIAYSNAVKRSLLGVPAELIDKYGAVSKPVVEAMAAGCRSRLASNWSLAISGVAGPGGGTPTNPVGLVCLALEGPGITSSWQKYFSGAHGRLGIQTLSITYALDRLRLALS
ncbi:competence/damage-inducible protein A [cyanobiont of Ornithocercus magnificus]|nr:competence/damage-inducible protein A [cyanobiont of Ornithocercus magnificus]